MTVRSGLRREACEALLIDLDGVLRRFDPAHESRVTAAHGLAAGALTAAAFEPDRLRPVLLGHTSHAEWIAGVLEVVTDLLGDRALAEKAVDSWHSYRGEVVPEVLATVQDLRRSGVPVALGTNATDLLAEDLSALHLADEVDLVINSSQLGHAKPSAQFFAAACERLGVSANRCLFVDDSVRNVRGARAVGLAAVRYSGPQDLRYVRAALRAGASCRS